MKKTIFALLFCARLLVCPMAVHAQQTSTQTASIQSAPASPQSRASVVLVISGGGATGFGIIPVLELMEELEIPVDLVVGSSIGAVVGGMYCAGYTPQEIYGIMSNADWGALFLDFTNTAFERSLGRHGRSEHALSLAFDDKLNWQLGAGLLNGQNVYTLLKSHTLDVPTGISFDNLEIPFRASVANLFQGQLKLFDQGDLSEVIRASMSIPGVFWPMEFDGEYYIDGLEMENNPVSMPLALNYDVIIDIDLGGGLDTNPENFNHNPIHLLIDQMTSLTEKGQRQKTLAQVDLVIEPVSAFSVTDYGKGELIYNLAKEKTQGYREAFIALKERIYAGGSVPLDNGLETARTFVQADGTELPVGTVLRKREPRRGKRAAPVLEHLACVGIQATDEAFVRRQFAKIAGKPLTQDLYDVFMEAVYGIGNYRQVFSRIVSMDGEGAGMPDADFPATLELVFKEKEPETFVVIPGVEFSGSIAERRAGKLKISADVQVRDVLGKNSVLGVYGTVPHDPDIGMMYRVSLGGGSCWGIDLKAANHGELVQSGWTHCDDAASHYSELSASTELRFQLGMANTLCAGLGIHRYDTRNVRCAAVGSNAASAAGAAGGGTATGAGRTSVAADGFIGYELSTLDRLSFPTRGGLLGATATGVLPLPVLGAGGVPAFETLSAEVCGVLPVGKKLVLALNGFCGSTVSGLLGNFPELLPVYGFALGDRQYMPQIAGSGGYGLHKAMVGANVLWTLVDSVTMLGGQFCVGVSGAVGNVWGSWRDVSLAGLEWRVSADTALRLTRALSVVVRFGAGTTGTAFADAGASAAKPVVAPFISFDFGNIRF